MQPSIGVDDSSLVRQIADILLGKLSLGGPAAGQTNGVIDNVKGSFVTVEITSANAGLDVTCSHNMNLPLLGGSSTAPNVTWLVMRVSATGATVDAASTYGVFYDGGTVAANSIDLKFGTSITLGVGDSLTFVLFFMPSGG